MAAVSTQPGQRTDLRLPVRETSPHVVRVIRGSQIFSTRQFFCLPRQGQWARPAVLVCPSPGLLCLAGYELSRARRSGSASLEPGGLAIPSPGPLSLTGYGLTEHPVLWLGFARARGPCCPSPSMSPLEPGDARSARAYGACVQGARTARPSRTRPGSAGTGT